MTIDELLFAVKTDCAGFDNKLVFLYHHCHYPGYIKPTAGHRPALTMKGLIVPIWAQYRLATFKFILSSVNMGNDTSVHIKFYYYH